MSRTRTICDRVETAVREKVGQAVINIHIEPERKAKRLGCRCWRPCSTRSDRYKIAVMVVTIPERKARTIQRLVSAAATTQAALASYAREHHGRFVLFGSFARGDIRPDSDIDIMVDFEAPHDRTARDAAETICRAHGLVPDVHLKSEVSPSLMRRIRRDGVQLP